MCLNTRLIVNPQYIRLRGVYYNTRVNAHFEVFGVRYPAYTFSTSDLFRSVYVLLRRDFPEFFDSDTEENFTQRYNHYVSTEVFYYIRGVKIPLFISANCGHCSECQLQKRIEYSNRAILEAVTNPLLMFYTLTYDDLHLPPDGLNRSDVVSFLKRFRENLAIWYSRKFNTLITTARNRTFFRTFYVGEYGVNPNYTRRAHYHGVFFFRNMALRRYISEINTIFRESWGLGHILDLQLCKSPVASARYITKYITKLDNSHVPYGKNPLFYQGPVKDGGLGCSNISSLADSILHSRNGKITVRVQNKVLDVTIPKAVYDKLFPSFSRVYRDAQLCFSLYRLVVRRARKLLAFTKYANIFSDEVYNKFSYLDNESYILPSIVVDSVNNMSQYKLKSLYMSLCDYFNTLPTIESYFFDFLSKTRLKQTFVKPHFSYEEIHSKFFNSVRDFKLHDIPHLNNEIYEKNMCPF